MQRADHRRVHTSDGRDHEPDGWRSCASSRSRNPTRLSPAAGVGSGLRHGSALGVAPATAGDAPRLEDRRTAPTHPTDDVMWAVSAAFRSRGESSTAVPRRWPAARPRCRSCRCGGPLHGCRRCGRRGRARGRPQRRRAHHGEHLHPARRTGGSARCAVDGASEVAVSSFMGALSPRPAILSAVPPCPASALARERRTVAQMALALQRPLARPPRHLRLHLGGAAPGAHRQR